MIKNIDRIAYLNTLGKKPIDLLLQIIEIDCFEYDFDECGIVSRDNKFIPDIIYDKYGIRIEEYILKKWLSCYFKLENKKIILKTKENNIEDTIRQIKEKEAFFLEEVNKVRNNYIEFAFNKFNTKINKEEAKKVFNKYIYTVAAEKNLTDENVPMSHYFIFQNFLKYLFSEDRSSLEIIENFGIANQIKDIVINNETTEPEFLKGCIIFLDTPLIMKYLGYDGLELGENYKQFFVSLKKAGASLKIFEHTFDELWGILFNFKRCIAQNLLDARGVGVFLKALKEFRDKGMPDMLSLDKDVIKNNIKHFNIDIVDISEEIDPAENNQYKYWNFDELEFQKILLDEDNNYRNYQARLDKDIRSISAISRLRQKDGLDEKKLHNYKDGKYYLLVDNYSLINALKEYYKDNPIKKNQLILENTILFDLWQQLSDSGTLNKALFRSKCFVLNTIDEKFKDSLYRETRKLEFYNSDLKISENIIDSPDIEDDVYASAIRDKQYDKQYIAKTLENTISKNKAEKEEEIAVLKNKLHKEIEKHNKDIEIIKNENSSDKKIAIDDYNHELIKKKIESLNLSIKYKLIIFIKKLFNQEFDKNKYLWKEACSMIGLNIEYDG